MLSTVNAALIAATSVAKRGEPVIAERLVALAHSLTKTGLRGVLLEGEPLRGMTGDAVEERSQHLRGVEPLRVERLVDQELVHDELVDRQARDALGQRLEPRV